MRKVLKFIFYSFILSIIVNIIYVKFINHQKILSLYGFSSLKVITGSMYPEIKIGDNIIIKKCKKYNVGDIITFEKNNEIITHRIDSIDGGKFFTKGDANNSIDLEPITIDKIYGKVIFKYNSFFPNLFYSFSKYLNSKNISLSGNIANPTFIVDGENEINIKKYSTVNTYKFSVRNYNENKVSDVDLEYNIHIIADKQVKYQVYSNNNIVDTKEYFILDHNSKTKHDYILNIEAPEDYQGVLKVNIYAFQKGET